MNNNYDELSKNKFKYLSFKCNITDFGYELIFLYQNEKKMDFSHKIKIKKNPNFKYSIEDNQFQKLIYYIGLIEGINYYKATCSNIYEVNGNVENKNHWCHVFYEGLSELRYLNNIDVSVDNFINIVDNSNNQYDKIKLDNLDGNLILVGGGKDSITTLELLKDQKEKNKILIMNPRAASLESAKVAGYNEDDVIIIEREIDRKIIGLEKEGFINGHVPFSAILSHISTLVAALCGLKYVVVSNENSANENTVSFANHQYSKSYEYESMFRKFAAEYLFDGDGVEYYSILRSLYEIQIVNIFLEDKKYLNVFKSCNVGSKIIEKEEKWCKKCAKCLFVYILLAGSAGEQDATSAIGVNMLDDLAFKEDFDKLIGKAEEKPFECIGTTNEVNCAMNLICNNGTQGKLVEYYKNECKDYHVSHETLVKTLNSDNLDNFIPNDIKEKIRKKVKKANERIFSK